jgi:shikimate kinase
MLAAEETKIATAFSNIRNIFLIGLRCTGKTTVAQIVARRLGWSWIDADAALETRHGSSIRTIFAEQGEKSFRDMESALLEEFSRLESHVVATGGGVVLDAGNRERMRQAGYIIWLTGDATTLWHRLQSDATTPERRPPLSVGGLAEIEELLLKREPLYRQCAHFIVDTVDRTPEEVACAILERLPQAANQRR